MTKCFRTALACMALVVAGCAGMQGGVTRSEIEELKADQDALRQEIAEIRNLLAARSQRPAADSQRLDVARDPQKGSAGAPLTIVEFTDYECPYCRRQALSVLPVIQADYVDTGKVRYVLRDFPLSMHKRAAKAAEAAHCAGDQEKYWEMHDALFGRKYALDEDGLRQYASDLGLDTAAFDACLESGRYRQRVSSSLAQGRAVGVRGTPSFVLGYTQPDGSVKGKKLIQGTVSIVDFRSLIDEMLVAAE